VRGALCLAMSDEQAAADLFAYFYSARFFERPGERGRGKQWFTEKHCAGFAMACGKATDPVAKPVVEWQSTGSSVALVNAMWNHASTMRQGVRAPQDFLAGAHRAGSHRYFAVCSKSSRIRASCGSAGAELQRKRLGAV